MTYLFYCTSYILFKSCLKTACTKPTVQKFLPISSYPTNSLIYCNKNQSGKTRMKTVRRDTEKLLLGCLSDKMPFAQNIAIHILVFWASFLTKYVKPNMVQISMITNFSLPWTNCSNKKKNCLEDSFKILQILYMNCNFQAHSSHITNRPYYTSKIGYGNNIFN